MRKIIKKILVTLGLGLFLGLNLAGISFAAIDNALPLTNNAGNYDSIFTENIILKAANNFEGTADGGGSEENILQSFFSGNKVNNNSSLIQIVNRILGAVGILYFIIIGVKYFFSQGAEDKMSEYKTQLIWIAVGLGVISVAEFIGFEVLNPDKNDILSNDSIAPFDQKVKQVIRFLEYLIGGIFLFNGIMTGYNMITSDTEDNISHEKTFLRNFIIGAVFILTAEVIIRAVSLEDGIAGSQDLLIGEIGGIVNFMLTFIAGACALMIILASLYYVASFGDEERTETAKKIIIGCVIGLVLAFSSYVIAQFLII